MSRLLSIAGTLQFSRREDIGSGCYVLNGTIGAFIKYATARLTPWSFTFQSPHKTSLRKLDNTFPNVLVLLVCNDDGIVALDYASTILMIGGGEETATISISRRPREMYSVYGTFGRMSKKQGDAEFAKQLLVPKEQLPAGRAVQVRS